MNTQVAGILELSVAERIQIVEEIWDSIAAEKEKFPLTDEIRTELDRRTQAYDESPDEGVTWSVLKERLTRSRRTMN